MWILFGWQAVIMSLDVESATSPKPQGTKARKALAAEPARLGGCLVTPVCSVSAAASMSHGCMEAMKSMNMEWMSKQGDAKVWKHRRGKFAAFVEEAEKALRSTPPGSAERGRGAAAPSE